MSTVYFEFIFALMMGFLILHYQDSHHRFAYDHDFTAEKKFYATAIPLIDGAIVFMSIAAREQGTTFFL